MGLILTCKSEGAEEEKHGQGSDSIYLVLSRFMLLTYLNVVRCITSGD